MIRKHIIAATTALALGITGLTAAPVQAGNDTGKVILGVAALAIVGTAIANSRNNDRRDQYSTSRNRGYSDGYYNGSRRDRFSNNGRRDRFSNGGHRGRFSNNGRRNNGYRY